MDSFDNLLCELKSLSQNKSQQGAFFELLMKKYFMTSPLYSEMFEIVWMWPEFPYNGGKHDTGIDIVAKKKNCDEYSAIQCKFYSEDNTVSKADVDTFISASGKPFYVDGKEFRYSDRIIVSSTDKWTSIAEETIEGQIPPVTRIRLKDLRDSGIDWDSFSLNNINDMRRSERKQERPHQVDAIQAVTNGFLSADRGKLIMACGTGKTFTSLKIAEALTKGKGNVLFLVPSISLLNQTLIEWSAQCKYDYSVFAICSDPKASRTSEDMHVSDIIVPATTNVDRLMAYYSLGRSKKGLNLFFSTYQSIDVISKFQHQAKLEFDLIICDEAHRTTGVTLAGEDESNFVKVHNDDFLNGKKRLYMTATPRIYGDESKAKANENSAILCSMDDEKIYGQEFYHLGFSEAVSLGLLSDYKVIVLAVDENYVSKTLQNLLTDANSELVLEDAVKIIGCLNGLSKRTVFEEEENYFENDPTPMKRAVAFNSSIAASKKFVAMSREIQDELKLYGYDSRLVTVELDHVDGKDNALFRKDRIDWLKQSSSEGYCRILSNARCLSEGIDVPALDAVIFLNPRNSIVDIIQSVGRVMRKAENKKYGYIILPIGIPAGMEPEEALADNKRYKIVWDVLQALRAHDDRFNNTINKIELNRKKPNNISIIGVTNSDDESGGETGNNHKQSYTQISMGWENLQKWKDSIYAKIVKKCGSRRYWESWAKDIADIANRHIERIQLLIESQEISQTFEVFLKALQENLNSTITKKDAVEMLAEHMITRPVFEALFENYEFLKKNPVSIIMQDMLDVLDEKALDKEQETLDKFYLSVQERAKGIDNAEGKQKIIIELYENFFKNALPKQVAKLGIVYTPIEVVDFILQSVEAVLNEKFCCSMNDDGVHVLDPFTGTGTFIVRLLRSGLILPDRLLYKYTNELHANEIVLLAYYIAAVNIEETFHDLMQDKEYTPFEGIVLTDTFALSESMYSDGSKHAVSPSNLLFSANTARATKQLEAPITVIIGNPPYSVGQKSGNDNNQNVSYPHLDESVADTYVEKSNATLTRNAYDTYIRAFRWATDRLGDNGVIGFVSNGAYIDGTSLDGFRACLLEDFNSVYCFNLRGNQRTSGELSRKEGGKIFGSGSRTPVAITILVKKKGARKDRYVHYYDIGDYLTREQKLDKISDFGNMNQIPWKGLIPNDKYDWINQRSSEFMNFIAIGDKKNKEAQSVFSNNYASGISTNRDAWVYSFSSEMAIKHAESMIQFYNEERIRCQDSLQARVNEGIFNADPKVQETYLKNDRSNDPTRISWSRKLFSSFCKNEELAIDEEVRKVVYRPYCKKMLAYSKSVIEMPSRWESIFPTVDHENLVICVSGAPIKKGFSVLMTDCIQDLHLLENSFCLPMFFYDRVESKSTTQQMQMFDSDGEYNNEKSKVRYKKRSAISDAALKNFQEIYGNKVQKEDIFYYLYAVLQNKKYIELYEDNLAKEMPRIPMLDKFPEYVRIGKELAELHVHYERPVDPQMIGVEVKINQPDFTVEKMHFKKVGKETLKDTIIFNDHIQITNIPEKAYEYVVNGKSAIEWLMERYAVTVDKVSGIVDDPNQYGDERYVFDLLLSVIYVSLKTQELIDSMPEYKEI